MSFFAERLQTEREKAGLSQYALSKRSGLSKQALSQLEMGIREPAWGTVQRIALALGIDCRAFADPGLPMPTEAESAAKAPGRPRKAAADADGPAAGEPAPDAAETTPKRRRPKGKK